MAEFRHSVRIYYEDTDVGGIVYYANYLKFAERARTEVLRTIGINQSDLLRDQRIAFAVRTCRADYLKPAFLDDELTVLSRIDAITGASLEIVQEIVRDATKLSVLAVKLACVNVDTGAPVRLPKEIREQLSASAGA